MNDSVSFYCMFSLCIEQESYLTRFLLYTLGAQTFAKVYSAKYFRIGQLAKVCAPKGRNQAQALLKVLKVS